jgi:hypothetical protein
MTNETFGSTLPGLNLAAMPGQRLATLELARASDLPLLKSAAFLDKLPGAVQIRSHVITRL